MRNERIQGYRSLVSQIRDALTKDRQKRALRAATDRFRNNRKAGYASLENPEEAKLRAKEVKRSSIRELEELLDSLAKNIEARGGRVYRASSAEDAINYIVELAKERKVKLVVKSKSMVTEEIHLNKALLESGIKVVETDLGERIVQLANEKPSHIIAPAIHKDRYEIAQLFEKDLGHKVEPEPNAITREARESLRRDFLEADMGITGANIAIAELGSLVLVTNEGNGRLVTALPRIHVALMGMEKVVRSLEDALAILKVLPRSATGQKLTSYVSMISGPVRLGADKEREFHLVILDNGRSKMRADQRFVDALNCLRCGACLNVCPTYSVVGGHVFGEVYTGAIGIPWTAFTHSWDRAAEIAPLCIACGLCEESCPVGIDIPKMIMHVKEWDIEHNGQPKSNRAIAKLESIAKLASYTAPLSNWLLSNHLFRRLMEFFTDIDRRRPMPKYHRETFEKWFVKHKSKGESKVAYFTDLYVNYNNPELGKKVVAILEHNGFEVVLPKQRHSGMPYLSYGMVKEAEELMRLNTDSLVGYAKEGCPIISSEPTAAFALKRLYPSFLGDDSSMLVANNSYELFEFLSLLELKGKLKPFTTLKKRVVAYHAPCHTKSMLPDRPVVRFLEMMGLEVKPIEYGCCGIAGTFGYKKGPLGYELSMEVGKGLFEALSRPEIELVVTESSVCKLQIEHGTSKEVCHPAELLSNAYGL